MEWSQLSTPFFQQGERLIVTINGYFYHEAVLIEKRVPEELYLGADNTVKERLRVVLASRNYYSVAGLMKHVGKNNLRSLIASSKNNLRSMIASNKTISDRRAVVIVR